MLFNLAGEKVFQIGQLQAIDGGFSCGGKAGLLATEKGIHNITHFLRIQAFAGRHGGFHGDALRQGIQHHFLDIRCRARFPDLGDDFFKKLLGLGALQQGGYAVQKEGIRTEFVEVETQEAYLFGDFTEEAEVDGGEAEGAGE